MNKRTLKLETGQSMVILVLGIIAFVAILALVLDGGNAYAAKRKAQNAADAGALAGAQVMCETRDEDQGIAAAMQYSATNGATNTEVDASFSNATVVVTATVTKPTFFAGLIGFDEVSPRADAAAECRPPGMGVLPVAWACRADVAGVPGLPGEACVQKFVEDCNNNPYDLDCTYLLMDSVKVKKNCNDPNDPACYVQNDLVCSPPMPDPLADPPCYQVETGKTDCDFDNDCIDELMTGGARSWLDLDGGGGGANELTDWIDGSVVPDPIAPHTWVAEESGVATSIFHTVANYIVGKEVVLPVFNKLCDGLPTILDPESTALCNAGSGDDQTLITSSTLNFHIMSFSLFHVTCVQTGKSKVTPEDGYIFTDGKGNDCNGHLQAENNCVGSGNDKICSIEANDKTIEGYFIRKNTGGYGGWGDWVDTGTFTVVLTK